MGMITTVLSAGSGAVVNYTTVMTSFVRKKNELLFSPNSTGASAAIRRVSGTFASTTLPASLTAPNPS